GIHALITPSFSQIFPGLSVIRNPLKAQRLAEEINNKRGAVCTKHLLLS
ncbi:DUF1317 family protein, partial [Escherichia coli]